ncbi:MAG: hypothetical protein GF368_02690 [Candidatus Aenigmarchaeota archaeon]|nr:hypothetical protein [Candidatus Aenigmarchaeota archaeon]
MKVSDIAGRDWDVLIILDACRYDIFKKTYKKFLKKKSKLKKMNSLGRYTSQWLVRSFPKNYNNIIYVSGNPVINSRIKMECMGEKIDNRKKFFKLIDTWDWGWDESIGTTPPKNVNLDFLKYYEKFPEKRFVLHYMQPHIPYVPLVIREKTLLNKKEKDLTYFMLKKPIIHKILHFPIFEPMTELGSKIIYRLFKLKTGIDYQESNYNFLKEKYGKDLIRDFYKENLEYVLRNAKDLINKIDGKIVITSDHGEMLGEHGIFGHTCQENYKELIEVPWLEIEN